jgi:LCP family protein required for cell wall assembly
MLDEKSNERSAEEASIPSPRPIYSTKDYADKRNAPPPPPPDMLRSNARERALKRRSSSKNSVADWAWVVIAGTLFAVVLVVSFGALVYVQAMQAGVSVIPTAEITLPTPVVVNNDYSNVEIGETIVMQDGTSIELVPWDGQSRFTMVLVGLDRRPNETGLAYRTDTMLIVSIDPVTNSIGILSLPRDTYVVIRGYASRQRINSALVFGELERAGYGPTLMMETVQNNFGIRINDYMAVDFQAFIDVVDAIGGIDVTIDYTINDQQYPNMNYGYDPFYTSFDGL